MNWIGLRLACGGPTLLLLGLGLTVGCSALGGGQGESCTPCPNPADSVSGFATVQQEGPGGRAVATMKVGDVDYVCVYGGSCGCSWAYGVQWRSSDPAVAVIVPDFKQSPTEVCAAAAAPLAVPGFVGRIQAIKPGETHIDAVTTGPYVGGLVVPPVQCLQPGSNCVPVDVLRVVP